MANRYVNYDNLLKERHRLGLDEMSAILKVNAFNRFIDKLQTADVVEVVRCGLCKHCKQNSYTKDYVCTKMPNANVVKLDHYCSYGERRCG